MQERAPPTIGGESFVLAVASGVVFHFRSETGGYHLLEAASIVPGLLRGCMDRSVAGAVDVM